MASGDPGQESGEGGQRSMLCKSIAILCTLFVCNYSELFLAVSLVPVCRAFCQRLRAGRSRKPSGAGGSWGSGVSRDCGGCGGCGELKGELRRWPPVLCSGALGNQSQWRRTSATMVVSQAYQNCI